MKNILSIALLAGFCAACGTVARMDRNAASSFTSYPDGTFRFRSITSVTYPDNAAGEAARMEMLKAWLDSDAVCPKGYTITSRRIVPQYGLVSDVNYQGKCNK